MKKIFECSNGIEFFSNGESILGYLPKEEAIDFINSIIVEAQKSEEKAIAQIESILLQAINKSYIQLPKVVKIEVAIIVMIKVYIEL